mgnify:CR=1 FL=1
MFWYFLVGIAGLVASIVYNYLILEQQYASTPANAWVLLGGVTSNSAAFRIRLGDGDMDTSSSSNNNNQLIVKKSSDGEVVQMIAFNQEQQRQHPIMKEYGLYGLVVNGLEPTTRYSYSVEVTDDNGNGASSSALSGSFQTPAPEGTAFNFTIAAAGCAWTGSKAMIFDTIRQDHPDDLQLFLHLGDFHYEDLDTDDVTKRLDAIGTVLNSPEQAALYRNVPLAYVWDDHDFLGNQEAGKVRGDDMAREAALLSYQMAIPHYPLSAATQDNGTADVLPVPIYQAFTIGTVRFILTDLQSESNENSIYSETQKEWLFQELQQAAQYDFVVLVTSKPWIGTPSDDNDFYGSWMSEEYKSNRAELSNWISDTIGAPDGPQNLLVIGGDAHMVAFDDGTNTYYGDQVTGGDDGVKSFPILQTAPLDRLGSSKGGPYSDGCHALEWERTQQYSTIRFEFPDLTQEEDGNATATACMEIETFRVDPFSAYDITSDKISKEWLFSKRLCGKYFQPASSENLNQQPASCPVELISPISIGLCAVGAVLCAVLGCMTCIFSMRDPTQGSMKQALSGMFATLTAWIFAALTVSVGALTPYFSGINQFDLATSFIIAMVMLVVMIFILVVVVFCCSRNQQRVSSGSPRNTKSYIVREQPLDDPEIAVTDGPTSSSITTPSVFREATTSEISETNLPQGAILTGAKKLHAKGLKGQGIKVAVIDSGVDKDHPGFNGKVTKQIWYREGSPLSEDDHGTHVAGTIHLMAPEAELHDYRVFGAEGDIGVDTAIATAIQAAVDEGCQVINMSLGGPSSNDVIWNAVQYADSKGVVMVCAAGNEGDNNPLTNEISFPACYKECISVAAVAKVQGLPVAVFSNSNKLIDCAGIGVDVVSFKPGGDNQIMSGTSMACPHVCGLIACLLSSPSNTSQNIRQVLDDLAIDIDAVGFDNATGVGFVTYLEEEEFDEILPRKEKPVDIEDDIEAESVELRTHMPQNEE